MEVLTRLCPFRFATPAAGSIGGLCVGSLCSWFDEKEGRCVVAPHPVAKPAPQPKPKATRAKKNTGV